MLRIRLNTSLLHPNHSLKRSLTSQKRISTKSFPISATLSNSADIHHWAESDVDSFASVFLAHSETSLTHQVSIPGRSGVDTGWEDGNEVSEANAERGVLENGFRSIEIHHIPEKLRQRENDDIQQSQNRLKTKSQRHTSRHNPCHACSGIGGVLPTHRPPIHPTPVVRLT